MSSCRVTGMVPRWVTDFVLLVFSFSSFYLSFHLQGDKGSRGEKVRTARMLGGDLCVPLLGDPRLHLQLLMLGMFPHICPSCPHCLCQEQGSNGISHVADQPHTGGTARQKGRDCGCPGAWQMPASSDQAAVGTTARWGDASALHGGLTLSPSLCRAQEEPKEQRSASAFAPSIFSG